jgi:glycosyltransferase involved in cell wall biosynthesis
MLATLAEDVKDIASRITIIIANNASTDDTAEVIENWKNALPADFEVKIVHNKENIGAVKNVVSLFYLATTPYFMFLGDDDRLVAGNFKKIMKILEGDNPPSAVIQSFWEGQVRSGLSGFISYPDAAKLFYEFGNAWAGIVDCKAAVQAIEKRGLRSEIEDIVWPQTVLGYLAMHDSLPRRIYAADFEIGTQLVPGLNLTNKQYWVRSLYGILKAGLLVDTATNSYTVRSAFLRASNIGFIGHIRAIFRSSLIADYNSPDNHLRQMLSRNYGIKGRFFAGLLKISHYPRLLYVIAGIAYRFKNGLTNNGFEKKVKALKEEYKFEVSQVSTTKKRLGNWF